MAFIALQNYINSSIYDLFETLRNKEEKYQQDLILPTFNRTRIELIIGLANYFKHRDDKRELNTGTFNILSDFRLNHRDDKENGISPIFEGFDLLSENSKMSELKQIVQDWRENLWKTNES